MVNKILRIFIVLVGTFLVACGVALTVLSTLGNDPVGAFMEGCSITFNLKFGTAVLIVNSAFFVITCLFGRNLIGIGTIIYVATNGLFCDICIKILLELNLPMDSIVCKLIMVAMGLICIPVGLGLYQGVDLGHGPLDAVVRIVSDRTKVSLKYIRIAFDATMTISAFFLGGTVTITTIIAIILTGPIMVFTLTRTNKYLVAEKTEKAQEETQKAVAKELAK